MGAAGGAGVDTLLMVLWRVYDTMGKTIICLSLYTPTSPLPAPLHVIATNVFAMQIATHFSATPRRPLLIGWQFADTVVFLSAQWVKLIRRAN